MVLSNSISQVELPWLEWQHKRRQSQSDKIVQAGTGTYSDGEIIICKTYLGAMGRTVNLKLDMLAYLLA